MSDTTPQPADLTVATQTTNSILEEHWLKAYWRPCAAWMYMMICFADFILFPFISIMSPVITRASDHPLPYIAWQSLTLSNGGLVHVAFGAILGVATWQKTKERLAQV
jgi:membrane protein YqaA with SNARE-associated domain